MKISKSYKAFVWALASVFSIVIVISVVKGPYFLLVKYYYCSGSIKQRIHSNNGAISDYTNAIYYDSSFATIYINRGSVYLDIGRQGNAVMDYSQAISLAPENAAAYAYRGRAYYELRDLKNSLKDYDKAISLDSKFAYAYYQRGLLKYALLKDFDGGCTDLKLALQLGMKEAQELIDSGKCN